MLGEDEIAQVLAGLGDDEGVGVDGREDEGTAGDIFREMRFQRKAVFRAEQKAAMGEDVAEDDNWSWDTLYETSRDYLIEHSKDLEPMAILIEASARVDGLPGLVAAMTTMADLIEKYWEHGLFPIEDEDDGVEARFMPLSGLSGGGSDKDGTLIAPLRRMTLASDRSGGELRYLDRVVADSQLAAAQTSSTQREALTAEAQGVLDAIQATTRKMSGAAMDSAVEQLQAAETAWRRGISYIGERTKPRFPAASRVSDELRNMREWMQELRKLLPEDYGAADEVQAEGGEGVVAIGGGGNGAAGGPFTIGRVGNRDDALRAVSAAADYFERFEPLSPIGSALREVSRRARLSFADLLVELIPDSDTRDTFYWRSGIKPPEPVEESY